MRREKGAGVSEAGRLSPADRAVARDALKALWKVDAAMRVGADYGQYASLTADAAAQVSEAVALLPEGELRGEIRLAMEAYVDGKRAWDMALTNEGQLPAAHPDVEAWKKKYAHQGEATGAAQVPRDVVLKAMWIEARSHMERASGLFK